MIDEFNIRFSDNITLLPPLGFQEALFLWKDAAQVMTDSGGLQEETTALGGCCALPCGKIQRDVLQLKWERIFWQALKNESILNAYRESIEGKGKEHKVPPKCDGRTAERIWKIVL